VQCRALRCGYGYRSIEEFVSAAEEVNSGAATVEDISARDVLATIDTTARVTAMLEAGRVSLDNGGAAVKILYAVRPKCEL
jgi:D-galacturonate reductase